MELGLYFESIFKKESEILLIFLHLRSTTNH